MEIKTCVFTKTGAQNVNMVVSKQQFNKVNIQVFQLEKKHII